MRRTDAKNLLALSALALVAAWGCTASSSGDDAAAGGEDALALRTGSVDHAAIVEVSTMMLAGGPLDGNLDPYNQEDPYAIHGAAYAQVFAHRLAQFDAYDGKTDWNAAQAASWVGRVAAGNYLVVDTSKPCDFASPHTYLEIERAHMTGRDHATCGGRMPNEDALDVTLNFLVRGPSASALDDAALHDGVDHATQQATDAFPYLAEMNGI
jgi:hypothetical protein